MLERKEKFARVPQSLPFFWTMSIYITTLSLTKPPPIQLVGQDGKIADKKISPIKYLDLKTQISQPPKNLNKNPKVQSPTERPFGLRARNLVTMSVF